MGEFDSELPHQRLTASAERRGGRRVGRSGRSSGIRSSRRVSSRSRRRGVGGGRRSGSGFGAGGFLLRAGRQHQRRNECAKSKFGVHRSVPRREARGVRKPDERVFFFPRNLVTGRAGKFYRVPMTFEPG